MSRYYFIFVFMVFLSIRLFSSSNRYTLKTLSTQIDTTCHFNITILDSMLLFEKAQHQDALLIFISDEESNVLKDFVFDADSLFLNIKDFDKSLYLINVIRKDFKSNNIYQLNSLMKTNE